MVAGRPFITQLGSALYHTNRRTQSWLSENDCDHITPNIWLPNSLDWNPLDYYVLGTVEWETNKTLYNTKDELKVRVKAAFINLNNIIEKTYRRFRSCLEAIVETNDDFFE